MADVLVRMELMDKKGSQEFLDQSDHSYIRSKKLNSLSMKEYLETLETKFIDVAAKEDPLKELECVENFIKITNEEKLVFLERCLADIKEHEMTPYEHKQRKLQREAEAKRLKEEQEAAAAAQGSTDAAVVSSTAAATK